MNLAQFESVPVDQAIQDALLKFNDVEDLPLNGEFARLKFRYRNSIRNSKNIMTSLGIALVLALVLLNLSELNLKDPKGYVQNSHYDLTFF